MRISTLAVGILLVCAGPSFAQNNPQSSSQNNGAQGQQQTQSSRNIQQQVRANLQSAGFTDIKVMPESFLVRAKDKSGNPVMMVINPDSITAVTEEVNHQNNSATTGSGAGQSTNSNTPNNNGARNNNTNK